MRAAIAYPFAAVLALPLSPQVWRGLGPVSYSILSTCPSYLSFPFPYPTPALFPRSIPSTPIHCLAHVSSEVETGRGCRASCNVTCQICSYLLILPLHVHTEHGYASYCKGSGGRGKSRTWTEHLLGYSVAAEPLTGTRDVSFQ